jgi:hypothetical protein
LASVSHWANFIARLWRGRAIKLYADPVHAGHRGPGTWLTHACSQRVHQRADEDVVVVCAGGLVHLHHRSVLIATHARKHSPDKDVAALRRGNVPRFRGSVPR